MYVYIQSDRWEEHGSAHHLYAAGYYTPEGKWIAESDHESPEKAAERCHYLNGGK